MNMVQKEVRMVKIVKHFPGVLANDHINFEVKKGEIRALLGENGAGKTTLMNILYGLYQPDEGEIFIGGEKVSLTSPREAINLGIGMVHQHFMLVPTLSVTENVIIGLKELGFLLDLDNVEKEIEKISKKYGLRVDPKAKIWQLSVGEQQRVEIIKMLYRGAKIMILDEPTSVLTPQESNSLFEILKKMTDEGKTIIFITHKLDEVMSVSSKVTVLRKGEVVSTLPTNQTSKKELARMMVGREVLFRLEKKPVEKGEIVLEIEKIKALSDKGILALKGVSFKVFKGEILGIAGVAGNGQKELAEVINGLRKSISGKVYIDSKDVTNFNPGQIIRKGVSHIPEDKIRMGLVPNLNLAENLIIKNYKKKPFSNRFFINESYVNSHTDKLIEEFDIDTPDRYIPVKLLSGGNLQKLLLAREISEKPNLIVAVHPTRGLDIGATEFIRGLILKKREEGAAILLISEDLEEILSLSDRIAVIFEGKITGIVKSDEAKLEDIGLMMAGAK